jgi:hypothetical protein
MPLWFLLLLGGAAVAVAAGGGSSRPIDEATIQAVTKHALVAESDVKVLRKLQDLLSHSGRFELAGLVMARANAFDQLAANTSGSSSGSIHAPRTVAQPQPPPSGDLQSLKAQLATLVANYQNVIHTPYYLTHPAFQQIYTANFQKALADLQAKIKAAGG